MVSIERFEDLEIWKLSRLLSKEIYEIIENTDQKNNNELRDQIEGSLGSILDNIALGFHQNENKEFIRFLSISKASCGMLTSQLHRVFDRTIISEEQFENLIEKIKILRIKIGAFIFYLDNSEMKDL